MNVETDQIQHLLATYERSLNTGDPKLAAACYTPDGIFMPTTLPTAVGSDLEGAYTQIFQAIRLDIKFTIDELVVVSDEVAYALTHSAGTVKNNVTGEQHAESNREIFLFKKIDGDWKIARYMFNKAE